MDTPGTFPIRITAQVGDWHADHEIRMTYEQRANMRNGFFNEQIKRLFDEVFQAFETRYPNG